MTSIVKHDKMCLHRNFGLTQKYKQLNRTRKYWQYMKIVNGQNSMKIGCFRSKLLVLGLCDMNQASREIQQEGGELINSGAEGRNG